MHAFGPCSLALTLTALLATTAAFGQTKPASPVPVGNEPVQTTATYGNWTLRCETPADADKPRHLCEVVQLLQPQNQQTPIAQVAFGKLDASNILHIVAVLPVNVVFPSTVRIGLDDKDSKPVELTWRRCLPGGCFAEAPATEDALARWRGAAAAGRLMFKDAANRDIAVTLPFRGLGQALDALAKQ